MPAPTEYAEEELAVFILRTARGVAPALNWVTQADVQEVIDETLLSYDVSDITAATDIRKLRILARYHTWKAAVEQLAGKMSTTVAGVTWNRDRLQAQAKEAFQLAKDEAAVYIAEQIDEADVTDVIRVTQLEPWSRDPYRSAR